MTRIEFWSAVMGLLVAVVVMFNQMNGRIDRLQADTNRRFDLMIDRMDRMQAENNRRFDQAQAEENRRFEVLLEAMTGFERRLAHVEGRLDAQDEEPAE